MTNLILALSRWSLFLVGPIALLAPKGLYIPLILISVLGCFTHKFKSVDHLKTPVWGMLGLFVVWLMVSYFWSMNPNVALATLKKVIPVLLTAPLFYLYMKSLTSEDFDRHLSYFFKGMWLCVGALVIDYFMDYPLIDIIHTNRSATYSRFLTTACLVVWLFELTQKYPKYFLAVVGISILGSAWVIWPYDFDAGSVALILGCALMGVTAAAPRLSNRLLAYGAMLAPLGVAFIVGLFMTKSVWSKIAVRPTSGSEQQRLEMIDWASKNFLDHPLQGIGIGQTPELSIVSPVVNYFSQDGVLQTTTIFASGIHHLHNGLLQILLELGAVGSLLLGAFMFLLITQGYRRVRGPNYLAVMHGYVTSLLFIVSVSFGVWQIWWLSIIIMTVILFSIRVSDER